MWTFGYVNSRQSVRQGNITSLMYYNSDSLQHLFLSVGGKREVRASFVRTAATTAEDNRNCHFPIAVPQYLKWLCSV
jgi:hypothetical protein